MPLYLQLRLQNKFGFYVQKREFNEYIIFNKYTKAVDKKGKDYKAANVQDTIIPATKYVSIADIKVDIAAIVDSKKADNFFMSDYRQKNLLERCDRIVKHFMRPYDHVGPIRTRLHNMAQGMLQQDFDFVHAYMEEHFPLEGNKK